jgi:hypothetical protein
MYCIQSDYYSKFIWNTCALGMDTVATNCWEGVGNFLVFSLMIDNDEYAVDATFSARA